MIEALFVKELESIFKDEGFYTSRELGVGYGVADLVLFKPNKLKILKRINHKQHSQLLGENYFKVLSLITDSETKKSPTHISELRTKLVMSSQTLKYKILPELKSAGYIKEFEGEYFLKINGWLPICKELVAIEAKLHDWKKGIQQAVRYKSFAHKVYLAVPSETAHNVSREILRKSEVGLITFDASTGKKRVIVRAVSRAPKNPHKRDYASEYFWTPKIRRGALSSQ